MLTPVEDGVPAHAAIYTIRGRLQMWDRICGMASPAEPSCGAVREPYLHPLFALPAAPPPS